MSDSKNKKFIGDLEIMEVNNGFTVRRISNCGPMSQVDSFSIWVFSDNIQLGEFLKNYYSDKVNYKD